MSDTTSPPPTASKRAGSPFSPETGTASKRAREEVEEGFDKTSSIKKEIAEVEDIVGEKEKENGNEKVENGSGEVKKMEDVTMEG